MKLSGQIDGKIGAHTLVNVPHHVAILLPVILAGTKLFLLNHISIFASELSYRFFNPNIVIGEIGIDHIAKKKAEKCCSGCLSRKPAWVFFEKADRRQNGY